MSEFKVKNLNQQEPGSILFIDDDKFILDGFHSFLHLNYTVHTAQNLDAAWKIISTKKIDCIFCDMNLLPQQNGLELLKLCRSKGLNIPFVLISGFLDLKKYEHAFKSGATDVLEKPLRPDYIQEQLHKYKVRKIESRLYE